MVQATADLVSHLLVETGGPWSGPSCARFLRDAQALAGTGQPVRLVLIQNGVTAAVRGALPELGGLPDAGVEVWADDFSLGQRGLLRSALEPSVRVVGMPEITARLLEPSVRVVWH